MKYMFKTDLNTTPPDLVAGLQIIASHYPRRLSIGGKKTGAIPLAFQRNTEIPGPRATGNTRGLTVSYRRPTDAFRALGRLLGIPRSDPKKALDFTETVAFDTMGLMLDVSRNGVYLPSALEKFICQCALMGLNMLMLYTEDTYEVPGEPFMGYLRGGYTQTELRALNKFAGALGVEMIPCMQALGHMEQFLQWPANAKYRDTDKILLAEDKATYRLIEKLITAATQPYSSKRIHIGMDEAHGLGSGQYRKRFGEKRPFDILNRHLAAVRDICSKAGLRPMIWSDMYFRLGSKTNHYYDPETVIPTKVIKNIPRDVDLVYWDYYHHDSAFYEDWIARHRALGSEPLMAGGIYTWSRFWTALNWTFSVSDACLKACKKTKLREVFMTMWGDDGAEHNLASALPGVQFFAEHAYSDQPDTRLMRANFNGICEADFDSFVKAGELDDPDFLRKSTDYGSAGNISKALLWQDPALAIFDPQLTDADRLTRHYASLAKLLTKAAAKGAGNRQLKFPALIAECLAIKTTLRRNLAAACRAGNRKKCAEIAATDIAQLRRLVKTLWRIHRAYWMENCKPFGWETVERRYGGLLARLDTLSDRTNDFARGKISSIPELEAELLPIWPELQERVNVRHSRAATPSCIG